jgi:serine/threonine protein kinase
MTADRTARLSEIGAVLAARMPNVLDAAIALLESVPPAVDAARPQRYEIQHPIGAGGQAEVLLGIARGAAGFHRLVAVKRVRSDLADAGSSATRLIEEAHLASRLSHPNVVSVLDVDRDKAGQPFLVMEYVDGVDLGNLIATGPVPYPVAIFIVRELLSGLGYIHESRERSGGRVRGLVHRDVSPQNVLLSWEGEVKLADFGVAQTIERTMTAGALMPVGKAGYMSPEQVNRHELDGRSELYAVGSCSGSSSRTSGFELDRRAIAKRGSPSRTSRARACTARASPPTWRLSPCGSSRTTAGRATRRPSSLLRI